MLPWTTKLVFLIELPIQMQFRFAFKVLYNEYDFLQRNCQMRFHFKWFPAKVVPLTICDEEGISSSQDENPAVYRTERCLHCIMNYLPCWSMIQISNLLILNIHPRNANVINNKSGRDFMVIFERRNLWKGPSTGWFRCAITWEKRAILFPPYYWGLVKISTWWICARYWI